MKSFLIVDDSPCIIELYKALIKRRYGNVSISQASNGKDALGKATASDYTVILSDIDMPTMNGIDFHKILKRESPLSAERTIFISGGPHRLDMEYIKEENLPYLSKSFKGDDFYAMIDKVLETESKLSKELEYACERRHERRQIRKECTLEPINPGINDGLINGEVIDISEAGLGLRYSARHFSEISRVKVSIKALSIFDRIAEVRWASKNNGDFRCGLAWA